METINPEQVQLLDRTLPHTNNWKLHQEQIKHLEQNDNKIFEHVESLEKKVDVGFERGKATMSEHSRKIESLDRKVENMTKEMKDLIKSSNKEVLDKIADRQMSDLQEEIRTLKKREEKEEIKKWERNKIALTSFLSIVGAIIASYFVMKG